MRVTLEYNLPENKISLENAIEVDDNSTIIDEFFRYLRNAIKCENLSKKESEVIEKIRDKLIEIQQHYYYGE